MMNITSTKINIKGLFGKLTTLNEQCFLVGAVFYKKQLLTIEALYELLKTALAEESFDSLLMQFSGFYSFVFIHNSAIICVVDRIRSRPLFYAFNGKHVYLSDSAQWLVEQLPEKKINQLAEQELQRAGYISGEDTLIAKMQQLAAGSRLVLTGTTHQLRDYYHYAPNNHNTGVDSHHLHQKLDSAMKESIAQLIHYANGRQLVVPLSGGYDSRAIALYLKEFGYHNIVAFTFGKVSSSEVAISKLVAGALDFKWYFVEYNRKLWRNLNSDSVFHHFLDFISSYVSVPNIQVFPAVKQLIKQGVISPDAIVVPGHTGDFVSGRHIPPQLIGLSAKDNLSLVVNVIITRHYPIKSKLNKNRALISKISTQVEHLYEVLPEGLPAASLFEAWEYKERQAKFIVNSNRYYDYFDLDWWMPLWHESVTNFWVEAPLDVRVNSTLWKSFIGDKYFKVTNTSLVYENVNATFGKKELRFRRLFDYFTDANGLYALVPFWRWLLRKLKYPYANGTVFSYLSSQTIKKIKKNTNN